MTVSAYTIFAWSATILALAGYAFYVRRMPAGRQANLSRQELRDRDRARAAQQEKEKRARKLKVTGGEGSGNEARKRKTKKEEEVEPVREYDDTPEDKVDDREFARQLSNAKAGTTMAPKNETGSRQKSVKLSKAKASHDEIPLMNGEHVSDGDDDMSSVNSPEVTARGDVSDMLTSNASAPPTLRLTASTQPDKPKKAAPKPKEPELTQKQRQNKRKAEEKKLLREEEEAERKKQQEKQRRTAREAEGRSAKDGSSTLYSPPPPASSAWTNTNGQAAATDSENVQLLDTYSSAPAAGGPSYTEATDNHQPSASQPRAPSPAKPAAAMAPWSVLPTEEEQIQLLREDDAAWSEVKSKKGRTKLAKTSSEIIPSGAVTNGTDKFANFETEA